LFSSRPLAFSKFGSSVTIGLTPREMCDIDRLQASQPRMSMVESLAEHATKMPDVRTACVTQSSQHADFQRGGSKVLPVPGCTKTHPVTGLVGQRIPDISTSRKKSRTCFNSMARLKKRASFTCERSTVKKRSNCSFGSSQEEDAGFGDYHDLYNHRTSRYQIHPHGSLRQYWDMLLMALVLYNTISAPLQLAFFEHTAAAWRGFDVFVDIFFVFDVPLNFCTAAQIKGNVVFDFKMQGRVYLLSWCLVDLVSSFPWWVFLFGLLGGSGSNGDWTDTVLKAELMTRRSYCLLRLLRIFRLPRIMNRLEFALLIRSSISSLFKVRFRLLLILPCVKLCLGFRYFTLDSSPPPPSH
jgi:hypothetical protein